MQLTTTDQKKLRKGTYMHADFAWTRSVFTDFPGVIDWHGRQAQLGHPDIDLCLVSLLSQLTADLELLFLKLGFISLARSFDALAHSSRLLLTLCMATVNTHGGH